jgi:phosphoglycerol transferase
MTVTALFSASTDNAARLHMRYYSFVFPLLLAVVAPPAADEATLWGHRLRVVMTAMLALPVLIAAFTHMQGLKGNLVDCPEITGLLVDDAAFHAACALVIGTLALWAWVPRLGAKAYLFVCLPAFAAIGTFQINAAMRNRLAPDVYDRAGQFTRQYLPNVDIAKVVVVGTDKGEAYRTLFHLDSPSASLQILAKGVAVELSQLPAGKEWALVIGDHPLVGHATFVLDRDGYRLAHGAAMQAIDFRQTALPGVADVAGLSSAEPWGRWSSADTITLTFVAPLPARFVLHVRGRAYGPNIGADIVARIGGQTAAFELPADIVDREIVLENPQRARTLSISVPHPVAPRDIGMGEDVRRLGVGLVELRISPR